MLFASSSLPSWAIVLILFGAFGLLVIIIMVVKKFVSALQIKKDNVDEKEAIQQELDRVLVPIDEKDLKEKKETNDEKKD